MTNHSNGKDLEHGLILFNPDRQPFVLPTAQLFLIRADDEPVGCHLIGQLNHELYQQAETQALFNLEPDIRGPQIGGEFLPDQPIQLEVALKPDVWTEFCDHLSPDENTAAQWFAQLCLGPETEQPTPMAIAPDDTPTDSDPDPDSQPIHPLLQTNNWLCLSVKQAQPTGEVSYKTLWGYVDPTQLQETINAGGDLATGFATFMTEWLTANLEDTVETTTHELVTEISQAFDAALEDEHTPQEPEGKTSCTLLAIAINFFETDGWPFAQLEPKTTLQLAFQGNNGQWSCYATTNEARQEFVFYSLCPANPPEPKRLAMAEFLTRANYGLTLGNFEMDLDSGEIHFKTSIDVEGDRLSSALVQRLVYTNVAIFDHYLPGIMAMIYNDTSPQEAIALVEGG